MNLELVINGALAVIGAGLLAAGIILLIKHKTTGQTVFGGVGTAIGTVMLMIVLLTTSVSSVSGPASSGQGGAGAPIVDNGAIITGKVASVTRLDSGYPWQIGIQVEKIDSLGDLPDPISGQEGQLLTLRTDQNAGIFNVGQAITGIVRLSGDVEGETFLYLSISK